MVLPQQRSGALIKISRHALASGCSAWQFLICRAPNSNSEIHPKRARKFFRKLFAKAVFAEENSY